MTSPLKYLLIFVCLMWNPFLFAMDMENPKGCSPPKRYSYMQSSNYVFQPGLSLFMKNDSIEEEAPWSRARLEEYLNFQFWLSLIKWERYFHTCYCLNTLPWGYPGGDAAFARESICALSHNGRSEQCLHLVVNKLLTFDLKDVDCDGHSPLWWATRRGYLPEATILLEAGADANEQDPNGKTLLHFVIERDDARFVELLLRHGARTDIRGDFGMAPIHSVIAFRAHASEISIVEASDVNLEHPFYGTPLHMAVHVDKPSMLLLLRAYGADLSAHDPEGRTPLELARELGTEACIYALERDLSQY